jgi:HEAT repeat protein
MGGKERFIRGTAMRKSLSLILFILLVIKPSIGLSSDYDKYLPNWLELLDKGNEKEKKIALNNLWILKYPEYRKDSRVFDPILKALKDKNPSVREAAASYLKHLGKLSEWCCKETSIIPSLIGALEDSTPRVREEASAALAYYKDWQAIDPLIRRLKDESPWVRLNAAFALGELKAPRVVDPLLDLLNDQADWRNKFVQQECVIAIRKIGHPYPKVITVLINNFNDPFLKPEIIKTLGKFQVAEARDLLIEASKDPNERIRKLAVEALSRMPGASPSRKGDLPQTSGRVGDSNVEVIVKSLNDPSAEVRAQSAEALGRLRDNKAVEPLLVVLNDKDERVREKAVVALGNFSDERIFDALVNFILKDSNANLRNPAEKTFKSVAEKTCKEKVLIRRKQEAVQEVKSGTIVNVGRHLMVHPVAVNRLIGIYSPNPGVQVTLLNMIGLFWDARIEEYFVKCLGNPSPQVRQKTLTLLDSYGSDKAISKLIEALRDKDRGVRTHAARTLGYSKDKRALEPLIERLNDSDDEVRAAALISLGNFDDRRVSELSLELLRDKASSVRSSAVWNIKKKPDKRAVESLILLLSDPYWLIPPNAAEALGIIGDKRAVEPLIKALKGEFKRDQTLGGDYKLRETAVEALGLIGDKRAAEPLIDVLKNEKEMRGRAAKALGLIGDKRAVEPLIEILITDKSGIYSSEAAEALGNIGDERAIEPLEKVLKSNPYPPLKYRIEKALEKIKKSIK